MDRQADAGQNGGHQRERRGGVAAASRANSCPGENPPDLATHNDAPATREKALIPTRPT